MNTITESNTRPRNHRARWAAIGAAVAVTLGAGGIGVVRATSPDGAAAYVAIEPCRLLDTRAHPDFHVGPHATLAANAQIPIDGWGAQGECTSPALPTNTTGLQLNVTAVGATEATYLTLFPGTGTPPNSSSLNPTPGQPPVPNAVTTQLDGAGQFSVYNKNGSVDIVVDVVGYFTDHRHSSADIVDEAGVAFSVRSHSPDRALTPSTVEVGDVRIRPPADGWVTVLADVTWHGHGGLDVARCQITKGGSAIAPTEPYFRLHDFAGDSATWNVTTSAHRTFPVSVADNGGTPILGIGQDFNVVCNEATGDVRIASVAVTAQYFPTSYRSGPLVLFPLVENEPG